MHFTDVCRSLRETLLITEDCELRVAQLGVGMVPARIRWGFRAVGVVLAQFGGSGSESGLRGNLKWGRGKLRQYHKVVAFIAHDNQ